MRTAVGVCDVSTLGKIDVQGPDAGAFLDRVYINTFSTLPVGRARYGVMLREDGFVMDDGTVARLGPDHFVLTTTTANAAKVMQHIEFCHQVLWPELDVQMRLGDRAVGAVRVAGPRSRDAAAALLRRCVPIVQRAPSLSWPAANSACGGVPARLFRISFSGELAYEIAVPAGYGEALVRALMAAGAAFGVGALRHRSAGGDADREGPRRRQRAERPHHRARPRAGSHDVHQERLHRRGHGGAAGAVDPGRPALVGLRPVDRRSGCAAGAHLLPTGATPGRGERRGLRDLDAFRRRSDIGSGSVCWRAGPSGWASRSGSTIRFGRKISRPKSSHRCLSIRKECDCVAELKYQSPWNALAPVGRGAGVTAVSVHGRAVATLMVRKGKMSELADQVGHVYSIVLRDQPKRSAANNVAFLGIGPGKWLAMSDQPTAGFVADMAARLEGLAAVVDQSDALAILRLSGPALRSRWKRDFRST